MTPHPHTCPTCSTTWTCTDPECIEMEGRESWTCTACLWPSAPDTARRAEEAEREERYEDAAGLYTMIAVTIPDGREHARALDFARFCRAQGAIR